MQPKSRFDQSGNRRSAPSSRRHAGHAQPIIEQLEGRDLFSGTAVATVLAPLMADPNALTVQNPGTEAAPKPVSTGTISGTVYNDANLDGVRESGEAGLVRWQVYADLGNHGVYTHGDPVGVTNAAGQYTIAGLKPGAYRVREVPQNGWSRTQPAGLYPLGDYDISLVAGQVRSGVNFGDALPAPANVVASTTQTVGILVTWSASSGTGVTYEVYRDSLKSPIATNIASTSFLDKATTRGAKHTYWVVTVVAGQRSPVSASATGVALNIVTVAAPQHVTASTTKTDGILVAWSASSGTGVTYEIYRDSLSSPVATNSGATSFLDTGATPGTTHTYWVVAVVARQSSAASTPAAGMVLTITVPQDVAASTTETDGILVTWSASSENGVTYEVYRDSLGSPAATNIASPSFLDTGATPGTTHTYWVVGVVAGQSGAASAPATGMVFATVSVTTRYGDELVVTASGLSEDVSIFQSGSTLTINADQDIYVERVPAAGVFIYTRGGDDAVNVDKSVTVATTVETIDNSPDTITSGSPALIAWIDSTDTFTGAGTVHSVASFAGGVSKAMGASLPDPTDSGITQKVNLSLFGAGPVPGDVNQGEAGDCYFMASLAGIAAHSPQTLENSAVDMGDGTYVVQFHSPSQGDVFVRVNNDFSTGYFNGFNYAHPGVNNTDWAMVMEKAFCYFLTGANTYASIWAGCWMSEVYADFGEMSSTTFMPSKFSGSEGTFYSQVSTALDAGHPVTFATNVGTPDLVGFHAYTVISASEDAGGNTTYVVRNPWGTSGDALEDSQGYATVTFAQIAVDSYDVCIGL